MKVHFFTIVFDGMIFLPYHLLMLQSTKLDWHWHIVHGAAMSSGSTSWCNQQEPRLSLDGTTEYLAMIKTHPRVSVYEKPDWASKDEMVNEPLKHIAEPSILFEIDVDEIWRADTLERFVDYFVEDAGAGRAQFKCRYFLGVNILATKDGSYGNKSTEWLRAWKFSPGDNFQRHEPPQLRQAMQGHALSPQWLAMDEIAFDHWAWAFENQVAYKEQFYNYPNALSDWRRLQENTVWPVARLKDFLPWVDEGATADKIL